MPIGVPQYQVVLTTTAGEITSPWYDIEWPRPSGEVSDWRMNLRDNIEEIVLGEKPGIWMSSIDDHEQVLVPTAQVTYATVRLRTVPRLAPGEEN